MTIGEYLIRTNNINIDGNSELRHLVIKVLIPYWRAVELAKIGRA